MGRRSRRVSVDPARQAAFDALVRGEVDGAYLNLVLPRLLRERGIGGRDAGLATELANGTARLQGSYDAILDTCLTKAADQLQPEVRVGLRMGSHQLLSMRVPPHAAVSTGVELVRGAVGERPVGLVNAVLRRVAGRSLHAWLTAVAPLRSADLVGHLVVTASHPRWVVEAFLDLLGDRSEVEEMLAADNTAAAVALAVRPGLTTPAEIVAEASAAGLEAEAGHWSPYAVLLAGGDPAALRAVRSGTVGVQDEGSQLAALVVARAPLDGPDRRWLDCCAGPGGKAALLIGLAAERGAVLVAAERQPRRAALVAAAARRYPRRPCVVAADGTRPAWRDGSFDRVIVDAPCTGLGALRRRPDARWRRQPSDLATLVPLQQALLAQALRAARPGGVVAYVTCSPLAAETRAVVDAVLAGEHGAVEHDVRPLLPEVGSLGDGPHVQLWPHRHGTDAMFMALLRRTV